MVSSVPFIHARETCSDPPACMKQEQGQDQQDKRQSIELPRPASQEQVSITPQSTLLPTPTRPPSQEQGQDQHEKDSASTFFRPAAQEQATISTEWANQSGKDPSDVTLFQHFLAGSRPSTADDAANRRYTGPRAKTRMSTYIYTLYLQGRWEVGGGRWGWSGPPTRKIHNGGRMRERKRREVGVAWGRVSGVFYLPTAIDRLLVAGEIEIVW